jgi:hypothetical protein
MFIFKSPIGQDRLEHDHTQEAEETASTGDGVFKHE